MSLPKKCGVVVAGLVLSVVAQASLALQTFATDLPAAPNINLTQATCDAPKNRLAITMPTADMTDYRFVLYVDGVAIKQLNSAERSAIYAQGFVDLEDKFAADIAAYGLYGKTVGVKAFWRDRSDAHKDQQETVDLLVGTDLTKVVALGGLNQTVLVDPAGLNCTPVQPKLGVADLPEAPDFLVGAAVCDFKFNGISFGDYAYDNYRFVVTIDGQAIQLNTALREKLYADDVLLLEEVIASVYGKSTDQIPYGKIATVQAYYFDQDRDFDESLYANVALTVGAADRFIPLGAAQSVTLVDPASLKCDDDDDNTSGADTTNPTTNPATPNADIKTDAKTNDDTTDLSASAKTEVKATELRAPNTGVARQDGAVGALFAMIFVGLIAVGAVASKKLSLFKR